MWRHFSQYRLVRFLASLKLAVISIVTFIIFMIVGTVVESMHGADYAKSLIYSSPIFLATEAALFVNILFAALVRLPFKTHLTGFYITHTGLLLLIFGGALTSFYGVDGVMDLQPGTPQQMVRISEPTLYLLAYDPKTDAVTKTAKTLPISAFPFKASASIASLNGYDVFLKEYLPYASGKQKWKTIAEGSASTRQLWFSLNAKNAKQTGELSDVEEETRTRQLGALTVSTHKEITTDCFAAAIRNLHTEFLFIADGACFQIPKLVDGPFTQDARTFRQTGSGQYTKITVQDGNALQTFYPAVAPSPVRSGILIDTHDTHRLYHLNDFRGQAQVVFLDEQNVAFGKGTDWIVRTWELFEELPLPWMDLRLTINRSIKDRVPEVVWRYKSPQNNGPRLNRAALLEITAHDHALASTEVWADDQGPKSVTLPDGQKIELFLGPKTVLLPFAVRLEQFSIDTNPGTIDPSSFESRVAVLENGTDHATNIAMNRPLKKDGFTLYQSSYFPLDETGSYGSVLSVNLDPGRSIKYLGSAFLILGSTLHFTLRSRRRRKLP